MRSIQWWHMTSSDPSPPTTPNSTFCVAFHIFVVSEHRDFKFGVHVYHSKSQPRDNKLSLKGAWSRHVTNFKFFFPLKYLWNGLSKILQILYTGWLCELFKWEIVPQVGVFTVTLLQTTDSKWYTTYLIAMTLNVLEDRVILRYFIHLSLPFLMT